MSKLTQKQKAEFLRRAIDLGIDGALTGHGGPFGCVIVKDGKIVGEGCNRVPSSLDPTAHAEVVAIREACKKLKSFQLDDCYVFASCEPCPMCLGALYWARPKEVYFAADRKDAARVGFDDEFIYKELRKKVADRTLKMKRFDLEAATLPFQAWVENEKHISY